MKRRIVKKIDKSEKIKMRNFNKFAYIAFSLQDYFSISVDRTCWIRAKDGRILVYSKRLSNGKCMKGKGYYLWYNEPTPRYVEYFND